jgi:Tfp pilus assembly protein FimV
MRRRGMVGRPGGGLIGTMATTAVVVGTAKATSNAMDRHAAGKQQEAEAQQAAVDSQAQLQQQQYEMQQMQQQMAAMQQQAAAQPQQYAPAPAPAAAPSNDMMAQLQQLAQMKDAGILTEEEFQAAKAKLLGG